MSPDATDTKPDAAADADAFTGAFIVRIAAVAPPRVISAVIVPLNLGTDEPEMTAMVGWEGIETVSTSVTLEVDSSLGRSDAWSRFHRTCLRVLLGITMMGGLVFTMYGLS